jgi:hypothetical protein
LKTSRWIDRPVREFFRAVGDHPKEPRIYGGGCLISQSKDDDARTLAPGGRENIYEIQIEREHNASTVVSDTPMSARNLTRQGS